MLPRADAGTAVPGTGGGLNPAGKAPPAVDALLVAATPLELGRVLDALDDREERPLAGRRLVVGRCGAARVAAVVSGIGKANGAMATATALGAVVPRWVVSLGVGGAYPDSGLSPGALAVADAEFYGDEGVETAAGWRGLEATGVPLWGVGERRWFNALPVDAEATAALAAAAASVAPCATGPFVTVSTVTGSAPRAVELGARFGALCETMEGAAVAHGALVGGRRFAEVRGISNPVGPRDRAAWRLEAAAAAAQAAALAWLATLSERQR